MNDGCPLKTHAYRANHLHFIKKSKALDELPPPTKKGKKSINNILNNLKFKYIISWNFNF